jgi:hypothetical protein
MRDGDYSFSSPRILLVASNFNVSCCCITRSVLVNTLPQPTLPERYPEASDPPVAGRWRAELVGADGDERDVGPFQSARVDFDREM